jgi:hypothetical protein
MGRLAISAPLGLALLLGGCSLDFNEAVPCENGDHCPAGFVCNASSGRCEPGTAPSDDTGDDPAPEVDPDVLDEPGGDADDATADPDTAGDGPDAVPDLVEEQTTDPDTGGDACVPTSEICNGEDDDCDGVPDNGLDCGSCPDDDAMTLIVRDGMTPFCVDLYEASRPDATLSSPGSTNDAGATSRHAVIPWFGIGLDAATAACATAGKRLCTPAEWTEACGGPLAFLYQYNATSYEANTCNGADTPDPDSVGPTAARLNCVSPEGPRDMSGNLEEWVDGGTTRGGSFGDTMIELRCTGLGESPDPVSPGNAVGFRCCVDALTD